MSKTTALPGNGTRVARMGILHDTTTPAVHVRGSTHTGVIVFKKNILQQKKRVIHLINSYFRILICIYLHYIQSKC